MTAFARRRSLARHRLHYWHERLGAKRAAFATAGLGVRLVPVVVRPASAPLVSLGPPTTNVSVCVVANGVRVELSDPHGTDPQWVAALVHGLSKGCA